ncbi:MAG: hypothetical protein WAK17_02865 [Candidatus Nitrosopolaris sp.]|jgi:hypothetical protein
MDNILKSMVKQNVPYLVMGMATGFALTYFYGFLIALILNTATWVTISYMIRNYVKRSTGTSGFVQEKYLMRYALTKIVSSRSGK